MSHTATAAAKHNNVQDVLMAGFQLSVSITTAPTTMPQAHALQGRTKHL